MFLVTAKEGEQVEVQKLLHPLIPGKGKLMSMVYKTDMKRLRHIHRSAENDEQALKNDGLNIAATEEQTSPRVGPDSESRTSDWNPVDLKFFLDDHLGSRSSFSSSSKLEIKLHIILGRLIK